MIGKLLKRIKLYYAFYWRYRADLAAYLRSKGAVIGSNCSLLGGLASFNSAEPYLIRLGNDVTVTQGVILVTHDGGTRVFRDKNPGWTQDHVKMGPVDIGDNVFLGVGSIVLPNTRIGSNVVVGAGAVVTKDIPSNVVVAGVPARVICTVEEYEARSMSEAIRVPEEYRERRQEYLVKYFWENQADE